MNPERDTNAEIEALGLDVESMVGRGAGEIRAILAETSPDVALIVGTGGVPASWPREILDVDAASDRLAWFFQAADGSWLPFYAYSYRKYVVEFGKVPACIYTRRPTASPFARVRPIVDLFVDSHGTCIHASARWAERVLQQACAHREIGRRAERQLPLARPLAPPRFLATIERLEQMIGLVPPLQFMTVDDFAAGPAGRLTIRVACIGEGRGFLVYDGGETPRLHVKVAPGDVGELSLVRADGSPGVAAVPATGLRVGLRDSSGAMRLWLDAYAGNLHARIGDDAGIERAVKALLIAGPTDSAAVAGRATAVTLALMAAGNSNPSEDDRTPVGTGLHMDVPGGLLSIRDVTGTVRARLSASALDGERAAYVFAEGDDDAPSDRQ
ncbi:MAG: hypothetical protein HYR85_19190 [Planctomycetes bacterium]|nr:hypothetical protein [Planctomycetota bacterium]MBI3845425.1 hypothetical protein [Planctomycetota bacterium]